MEGGTIQPLVTLQLLRFFFIQKGDKVTGIDSTGTVRYGAFYKKKLLKLGKLARDLSSM